MSDVATSLEACFGSLADPRVVGRCEHKLLDIIIMAVCTVITGAESWVEVETFGQLKQEWLTTFLELPNGIPTHDTFGRMFAALEAEAFQRCFARWVEGVFSATGGQVVAVNGKTVRRSHNKTIGRDAIHMVSAWAQQTGIVLGQRKVEDKSNEITAIPELLRVLDVSGCIVTIDAMGCQKTIAHGEDDSRIRAGDSPQNMAVLRHLALNILKKDKSKGSLRQKRYKAALDDTFCLNC